MKLRYCAQERVARNKVVENFIVVHWHIMSIAWLIQCKASSADALLETRTETVITNGLQAPGVHGNAESFLSSYVPVELCAGKQLPSMSA